MNVLISAVSHASGISGVQRHALNLVRCLQSNQRVQELHIAVGPWQSSVLCELEVLKPAGLHVHVAEVRRGAMSRNVWHYRTLPELVERLGVDIVHLTYPVPVNSRALPCPSVVTLHDMYPYEIPSNFGFPRWVVNRLILKQCLYAVDGIACVSASTLAQLERFMPQTIALKAVCINNCVEAFAMPVQEEGYAAELKCPFLLCVAQHRRNKNLPFLLRVFELLQREKRIVPAMQLVIVGIHGPETSRVLRWIRRLKLQEHVRLLEDLPDAALHWCYAHCEALLAPSLTEGFGLPIVEAMQHGCRVICSDIAAFREFGANCCRFVWIEGRSAERHFAEAIVRSLGEVKPRAISFPRLSCRAIGKDYTTFYEEVISRLHVQRSVAVTHEHSGRPSEREAL